MTSQGEPALHQIPVQSRIFGDPLRPSNNEAITPPLLTSSVLYWVVSSMVRSFIDIYTGLHRIYFR